MFSRNSNRFAAVLALSLAATAAMAQPQPLQQPLPATGNGSISGVVTNSATGGPIPHAHVSALLFGTGPVQNFSAVTDGEGKFTIGGLPPGRVIITVDRLGFISTPSGYRMPDGLQPGEKKDIKLTLTPTGAISGHVLNAEGGPVQGAIVSLDMPIPGVNNVTTDEKGRFRIGNLPPGRYRLLANPAVMPFPPEIRSDGTQEVHYARTFYPGALTLKAGQRVEVGPGAETAGIDIRLVRTPVVTVSGKVVDAPPGGKTMVRALGSAATGGAVLMAGYVKPDGSFQIWQLDPGTYTLVATNTSTGPGLQQGVQSAPAEIEVAGFDIDHIELRMIPPFDVSVQVAFDDAKARELPTGQAPQRPGQPPPPKDAPLETMPRRVILRPEGQAFVSTSPSMFQPIEIGADESFTLQKLLPMRYRLLPLWSVYVKSVTVGQVETPGDILDLRNGAGGAVSVTLASVTGEVSGVVSDSNGPAPAATVALISTLGRGTRFGQSGPDGTYKLLAVPPGGYLLIAGDSEIIRQIQMARDPTEYADIAESVEVHAGDTVTRSLRKQVSGGK